VLGRRTTWKAILLLCGLERYTRRGKYLNISAYQALLLCQDQSAATGTLHLGIVEWDVSRGEVVARLLAFLLAPFVFRSHDALIIVHLVFVRVQAMRRSDLRSGLSCDSADAEYSGARSPFSYSVPLP